MSKYKITFFNKSVIVRAISKSEAKTIGYEKIMEGFRRHYYANINKDNFKIIAKSY